MTPYEGQSVVIFFRNGMHIDGKVLSWSDNKTILQSTQGTSKIVINNTNEDIMFYKIHNVFSDFDNKVSRPVKNDDDIRTVAELKNELNRIEREEIVSKLSGHEPSSPKPVNYGLQQQLLAVSRPIEHTRTQTARKDIGFSATLSNLFAKKYPED